MLSLESEHAVCKYSGFVEMGIFYIVLRCLHISFKKILVGYCPKENLLVIHKV